MTKILMESMQFTLYLAGVVTLLSFSHLCHVIAYYYRCAIEEEEDV